jgi:uncharacterized Tic20 family protein
MSNLDELQKLHDLKEKGAISQSEYLKMKDEILNKREESFGEQLDQAVSSIGAQIDDSIKNFNEDDWGMFLHLSQLAGYILPVLGFAVPILIWITKKEHSQKIDQHGRIVMNWMLSLMLYSFVAFLLIFVLIGFPLFMLLGLISLVFTILGAIKAKDGVLWRYPGSIPFFKVTMNEVR